jgi:hypothetical protein
MIEPGSTRHSVFAALARHLASGLRAVLRMILKPYQHVTGGYMSEFGIIAAVSIPGDL